MTSQFQQFCNNWLEKADRYTGGTLADHIDQFTTLYAVFNAAFLEAMKRQALAGGIIAVDFRANKAATEYLVQYLGSDYLLNGLFEDRVHRNNLSRICRILETGHFPVIRHWGCPQPDLDLKLLNAVRSIRKTEKAVAILNLFFHIHCNLFQVEQASEHRQKALLHYVNQLLRKTVELIGNKLMMPKAVPTIERSNRFAENL